MKKYNKEYYSKNRERILFQNKRYYQKNKERRKIYKKKYYQKNKERIRLYGKILYQKNKEKLKVSPKRIYQMYKHNAKRKNYKWDLTFKQFMIFWQKPCYYCGSKIRTIGLDRVDNTKGYIIDNLTSCCQQCNYAKRELTVKKFIQHCQKVIKTWKGRVK